MWYDNICILSVNAKRTLAKAFKSFNVAAVLWQGKEPERVDKQLEWCPKSL